MNRTGNLLAIGGRYALDNGSGVSPVSTLGTVMRGAVNGWQRNNRNPTTWTMRSAIRSPNPDFFDLFGATVSLCGTGSTLAVSAEEEDSKAKGIDGDRLDASAREAGAAYLY